jgi:hypothetical protein
MKIKIDVTDKKEADLIRRGLNDREVRAFVKVMAALSKLDGNWARRRVLNFVADHFREQELLKK